MNRPVVRDKDRMSFNTCMQPADTTTNKSITWMTRVIHTKQV